MRGRWLSHVLTLLLFGVAVYPQSVPTLSPPDQAYIYSFDNDGTTGNASAPAAPALNLGVTYSIEFWMMLSPFMREGRIWGFSIRACRRAEIRLRHTICLSLQERTS